MFLFSAAKIPKNATRKDFVKVAFWKQDIIQLYLESKLSWTFMSIHEKSRHIMAGKEVGRVQIQLRFRKHTCGQYGRRRCGLRLSRWRHDELREHRWQHVNVRAHGAAAGHPAGVGTVLGGTGRIVVSVSTALSCK